MAEVEESHGDQRCIKRRRVDSDIKMDRQEGVALQREGSLALQNIERQLSIEGRQSLASEGMPVARLLSLQSSLNEASRRGESTRHLSAALRNGTPLDRRSNSIRKEASLNGPEPIVTARRAAPDFSGLSRSFSVEARRVPSPRQEIEAEIPAKERTEISTQAKKDDDTRSGYHVFSWGRHALAGESEVMRFAGRRIVSAATSGWHALCVDTEGMLFAGGANERGQCAILPEDDQDFVQGVRRIEQVPVGVKICIVAAGLDFSAAVNTQGKVLTWGGNDYGQLGTGDTTVTSTYRPTLVRGALSRLRIIDICCGEAFCLARSHEGELYAWGDASGCCTHENLSLPTRLDEFAGVFIHKVAAGAQHALALDLEGSAYAWGRNNHGQCGGMQNKENELIAIPQKFTLESKIVAGACGRTHSLLMTSSGTLIGFGRDHCGQLTGSAKTQDTWQGINICPDIIIGKCVACAAGEAHSLIALENGELIALGRNQTSTPDTLIQKPLPPASEKRIFIALEAAGDSSICVCLHPQTQSIQREDSFVWRLLRMVGAAGPHPAVEKDVLLARRESSTAPLLSLHTTHQKIDMLSVLRSPGMLAFTWIAIAGNLERLGQELAGIDKIEMAKALETGARGLLMAGRRAAHAGVAVLAGLCASSFLGEPETPFRSRAEWLAVRDWAEVLLATSDKARAQALALCLPSSKLIDDNLIAMREAMRRPLRRLVIAACHRAALDGRLPSGDGIELKRAAQLIAELDQAAESNAAERSALNAMRSQHQEGTDDNIEVTEEVVQSQSTVEPMDVEESPSAEVPVQNGTTTSSGSQPSEEDFRRAARSDEAIRSYLEPSAVLYAEAEAAQRDGHVPLFSNAFLAGLLASGCLELLRSASSAAAVPRQELTRGYRVLQCDQLGVMIAQKIPSSTAHLIGVMATPGALLIDFLRWRKAGAPSGAECLRQASIGLGYSSRSIWWLSAFGFLFSPEIKRELCSADARRLQGEARSRAAQQHQLAPFLVFGFPVAGSLSAAAIPYLVLRIPRSTIVQATMNQVRSLADEELSKELRVIFDNEPGIDEGGVRKEFFQLIIPMLFDPVVGMFSQYSNCVFFNSDCDWYDEEYELAGLLVGLAVYNSVVLDLRLPNLAYKKLLSYLAQNDGEKAKLGRDSELTLTLDDLADLDPALAHGLQQLLDFDGDVENVFCRTFRDDDGKPIRARDESTSSLNTNLDPDTPVTTENRDAYVRGFLYKRLCSDVETQFLRFAQGFARVMRSSVLQRLVEPHELSLMVQGDPELDFSALEKNTYYEGWSSQSDNDDPTQVPIVKEFWRLVKGSFTNEEKKLLLMFFSGSKSAPMGGLSALKPPHHSPFRIQRAGPDSDRLPTASTCFNTLLLPDYDPPSKLGPLLRLAIENSEGFGLQ